MALENSDTIVAIDIGTTKVCTIVAQKNAQNKLELVAVGPAKSEGLKKGAVVDIDKTVEAIKKSIEKIKASYHHPITKAYISIAGGHIYSFNHSSMVAVRSGEVTHRDIYRAINMADMVSLPADRKILQIIPQHFKLDDMDFIKNPLGMSGSKLTSNVHVITGAIASIQNLSKCVTLAGIEIQDIILQPIASSEAVLTLEEKEMGSVLVDIGGGTTDLVVWSQGVPIYSRVIPVGGSHFSYDLMMALHLPYAEVETIKKNYGRVLAENLPENARIKLQGLCEGESSRKDISLKLVAKILNLRAEELLLTIKSILEERKLDKKVSRYIFTGGGALMRELDLLAQFVLEREVRIGYPVWAPTREQLQNPQLATVVGLLNFAYNRQNEELFKHEKKQWDMMRKLNQSLKNVFKEIF